MAQSSSYELLNKQLSAFLAKFKAEVAQNKLLDSANVEAVAEDMANRYLATVGTPISTWSNIIDGDPARSDKINEFLKSVDFDIQTIQSQVDVISAATLFAHNFIKVEVLKSQYENTRLNNKLKTLQLYSSSADGNVIYFGDSFASDELIDFQLTPKETAPQIDGSGAITLGLKTVGPNALKSMSISYSGDSNGIPGNNVEITNADTATTNATTGQKNYIFAGETNPHASLKYLIDSNPATWIEFESILVNDADKKTARNFGFKYANDIYKDRTDTTIQWGDGPSDGKLTMVLKGTLKKPTSINTFSLSINPMANKDNHPIKIVNVQVSEDGTEWETLSPTDVWLASDANLQSASKAANLSIGVVSWKFPQMIVGQIMLTVEQQYPMNIDIGHIYYESKGTTREVPVESATPGDDDKNITYRLEAVAGPRQEGPIPLASKPLATLKKASPGKLVRKIEIFKGQRWAIGLRDIFAGKMEYQSSSTLISKRFMVSGVVDRIALEADVAIPESFAAGGDWVKFYVSPDDGESWHQISRIENNYGDVPEILVFNDPTPVEFRDTNAGYVTTKSAVTDLRVKIEIERPVGLPLETPILNGYKLKIRKRA